MNIRVLLVESDPEDVLFLRDVLIEIESGRYWSNWVHIETLHASTWTEMSAILGNEPVDLILLDPDLPDSHGVETFRRVQAAAEQVPVILLIGADDDAMAVRMMREGAQDFLIKKQADCAPLAHAMLNAMERHRLLTATRAASSTDSLTGLPNRGRFMTYAERDRNLAERLGRRLMIVVAELQNLNELTQTFGEQRRDLALVETADHLRSVAGSIDLLARIGETRFAMSIFESEVESLEEAWARIRCAESHRILMGATVFDADRSASIEMLLDQATLDLRPVSVAMRH